MDLAVYAEDSNYIEEAVRCAEHLRLPLLEQEEAGGRPMLLSFGHNGLSLTANGLSLRGDFSKMLPRLRQSNLQQELLVRAARIKKADGPLMAVDATAGLGEDSLILAAAGFEVHLYEYNPIIAALLRDALRRAEEIPELSGIIARMRLVEDDSIEAMGHLSEKPAVIVLDPMFPERHKSAAVKKKFQLLQILERPDNGEKLLQAAFKAHPRKIVIKRPLKGPYLAGIKPNYSLSGKAIRYDCILASDDHRENLR